MSKQANVTRTVGTKGMPRKDRERLILDAAAEEFGRRGHASGSTRDVAARAGISKPMIYEYFGSKDGLYLSCLDRAGTRLIAAVESAQKGPSDLTRAARTLQAIFTALEPHPHDWDLVYDPTLPPGTDLHTMATTYRRELNRLGAVGVAEYLSDTRATDPLDADFATHLWYGTVTAAVAWWRHHPEQTAAEMNSRFERVFTALAPLEPEYPAGRAWPDRRQP
ncbi:TetR/AcrR family transcriptional regulator [Streptomyces cinnabarinus]|uniref:TetR/AcrR family transcriptional regulator n=1 Tax=Streptomyces cinnabarinus TaxID=67287 RepID=A0ABY7KNV5_9ACTN|nr:TetR/AcrR family transcriptional regulator [Streptomyces cinnabarinus]WAZ26235.1 TetR/AcrR family transcriptional regulator [Streptomyces cinnabarinus]